MLSYSKNAITNKLANDMAIIKSNWTSNASKKYKALAFCLEKGSKWLKGGSAEYMLTLTENGYFNTGVLLEIIYKSYKGYENSAFSPKGKKDLSNNRTYTELKSMVSPSGACKIDLNELNNNGGVVFITLKGNYKITCDTINTFKKYMRYDHKANKYIFTTELIEKYGKRTDLDF